MRWWEWFIFLWPSDGSRSCIFSVTYPPQVLKSELISHLSLWTQHKAQQHLHWSLVRTFLKNRWHSFKELHILYRERERERERERVRSAVHHEDHGRCHELDRICKIEGRVHCSSKCLRQSLTWTILILQSPTSDALPWLKKNLERYRRSSGYSSTWKGQWGRGAHLLEEVGQDRIATEITWDPENFPGGCFSTGWALTKTRYVQC